MMLQCIYENAVTNEIASPVSEDEMILIKNNCNDLR